MRTLSDVMKFAVFLDYVTGTNKNNIGQLRFKIKTRDVYD